MHPMYRLVIATVCDENMARQQRTTVMMRILWTLVAQSVLVIGSNQGHFLHRSMSQCNDHL